MSATALSKASGISQQTLSRWLREASTLPQMSGRDDSTNSRGSHRMKQRTPEEKLRVVMEAVRLSEAELGEFLRREGLHTAQLEEWRTTALAGAQSALAGDSRRSSETKQIRDLRRDLDRKNAALAEVTALLALQKKVQAIWGDEDESTPPTSAT